MAFEDGSQVLHWVPSAVRGAPARLSSVRRLPSGRYRPFDGRASQVPVVRSLVGRCGCVRGVSAPVRET